jgi:hypothetical protein
MRFLYKCKITVFNDSYNLNCIGGNKNRTIVFRGNESKFRLFLQRVKATDTASIPRSIKSKTYQAMVDGAKSRKDPYVYIFSNMLPKKDIIIEGTFFNSKKTAKEWIDES